MAASRPRFLERVEDRHCVLYHLAVVAAFAAAWTVWLNPGHSGLEGAWHKATFVLVAAPLLGWICGIDLGVNYHNHTHRPIFRSRLLGTWFERLWTPYCAWPAKYWTHYHVDVHHKRLMQPGDWTVRLRQANGEYESCLRYQLMIWPWRSLRNFPAEVRDGHFDQRTAVVELLWFVALYSIPFWIDPVMGLCLWLLPHWCGNCITMGRGMYIQHAGCEPWVEEEQHPHSSTILHPFFNATMFNIGLHATHHDFPGAHWSELPKLWQQVESAKAEAPPQER